MATVVYTDGACSGNPGPGGWAWAVPGGPLRQRAPRPTRPTSAWRSPPPSTRCGRSTAPLEVVSDSTYVVNCFRDRWWEGWLRRGWLNSQKKPVANRDLWEPFVELVRERGDVTFRWVKGHSGDPMNDLVDRLAVEAADDPAGPTGDGEPADLGPPDADRLGAAAAGPDAARRALAESLARSRRPTEPAPRRPRRWWCSGTARPSWAATTTTTRWPGALPAGWPRSSRPRRRMHDDLVVVSGLRLGAEMLGAEAARRASACRCVAVLPYPDPESVWPAASAGAVPDAASTQAVEVVAAAAEGPASPSSRPAPPWPGATPGSPATSTRPSSCGTASDAGRSASWSARSRTTSATTCGCSTRPSACRRIAARR